MNPFAENVAERRKYRMHNDILHIKQHELQCKNFLVYSIRISKRTVAERCDHCHKTLKMHRDIEPVEMKKCPPLQAAGG